VHRVIAGRAPGVTVIDISHQIPAHDVRAGALALWRAAPWLVPGVILAVVDPGVGGPRRAVAIEVAGAGAVLVGPDNGLLLPAATLLGPVTDAVELTGPPPSPSRAPGGHPGRGVTFAGRDLLAPASADLAKGVDLHRLGTVIDPAGLAGDPVSRPDAEPDGRLRAEVLWVDHFGNAQLNARPADAEHLAPVTLVQVGHHTLSARWFSTYAEMGDAPAGQDAPEVGLVTDSYGLLALSCDGDSAAALLGMRAGDQVWLDRSSGG
jgi:S-adenosylmethionine hydrolase